MEKKLQKQFEALETQRLRLLDYLVAIEEEKLNKVPAPNSWSINQIICHLTFAEELSYKSIKSKVLTGRNFEKSGAMNWVRQVLLRLFLRSSKKFKAPTAVSQMPLQSKLSDHILKWQEDRILLKDLLESLPESLLDKYIFKHPVAGKMTIYGGLSFFHEHVRRHELQIKKIVNQQ